MIKIFIVIQLFVQGSLQFNPVFSQLLSIMTLDYNVSSNFTVLTFVFSQPLNLTSSQFWKVITIESESLSSNQYSWNVTDSSLSSNFSYLNNISGIYDTYVIKLKYQIQFYFINMTIRFVAPYSVRDYKNTQYLNIKYQVLVSRFGPCIAYSDIELIMSQGFNGALMSILCLAGLLYATFKYILSNNKNSQNIAQGIGITLNLFWCLIDCAQLMNLFLYLNAELTDQVRNQLRIFSYVNFNYNFSEYNFFQQNSLQLPFFLTLQHERINASFCYNTFFQWVILLACLLMTIFSLLFLKQSPGRSGQLKDFIEYRVILRASSITLCSMVLAIFVEISILANSQDDLSIPDLSMMILSIIWTLSYLLISCYLLNNQVILQNVKYKIQKYGVLYDGLQTKAAFKRNIYFQQDIRKVLFCAAIVFLYQKQNTCISILIMIQIIQVTILGTKYPFRINPLNTVIIITEIMILVTIILLGCTIYLDYISLGYIQTSTRRVVGWLIVSIITLICLLRMTFMVFEFYALRYKTYLNITGTAYERKEEDKQYPDDYGMIEMTPKQAIK